MQIRAISARKKDQVFLVNKKTIEKHQFRKIQGVHSLEIRIMYLTETMIPIK